MSLIQTFQDAAQVAQDVAAVAYQFQTVPAGLVDLARDATTAILARSPLALSRVIDEADRLFAAVQQDATAAQPAIDTLKAHLQKMLADLS